MRVTPSQLFLRISILVAIQTVTFAQQPGTNVNVLPSYPNSTTPAQTFYPFPPGPPAISLTDALRGDGYLQRQVEPVVAPSTYNPDHLLAAFGDYRTVSLPGSTSATVTSEGWIGLSRSYDRGHTFYGSLVPGFPQDTSIWGLLSPLHGLQAGSDATLTTTPGGHFYIGGLFFTPGGVSKVAVVHFRDIPDTDGGDTIRYRGTVIVDQGNDSKNKGDFDDKPSIASDIARGTTNPNICGPVYIAYTIFTGSGSFPSKIGFAGSPEGLCGFLFTPPQYLNKNFKQNQGAAVAVDPNTGKIFVVWRHIFVPGGDGFPDGIVMVASTNGGLSFSAPAIITPTTFAPFDQPTVATTTDSENPTSRSMAYPTIAIDGNSDVYVAIQERTFPSSPSNYPAGYYSPRIILRTLRSGQSKWTTGSVVDSGMTVNSGVNFQDAQQMMPTLSFAAGVLRLMWYDFRDQNQQSNSVGGGWLVSGLDRHIETYVAQSTLSGNDANGNPVFNPSVPVTQYLSDVKTKQVPTVGDIPGGYPAVNRPNLPMYVGGTTPFSGDYNGMMSASPFVSNPGGKTAFRWATKPTDYIALNSYSVWADSRDVVFPTVNSGGVPNLYDLTGWTEYAPPGTGFSCTNAGARNENVYFSEIKPGIVAGSPATSRQLVNGSGAPIERAFPIYVQNPTSEQYNYQFTFANGSGPAVSGSFVQGTEIVGPATTTITLPVVPYSSATVTVFAYCATCTSSTAIAPFSVAINEQDPVSGSTVATTSVFFNSDPTAPFVTNSQGEPLSSGEIHNASVSNPQWANPQWANPQWANPQWANPQWANPQWANVAPSGASTPVGDLVWTVTDAGNNASAYTSIINVATSNVGTNYLYQIIVSRQYNFPGFSSCGSQPIPQDQIISIVPNANFSTPQWANPQWANPQWANPQWANATFAAVPPPSGSGSGSSILKSAATPSAATPNDSDGDADDGITKMPLQADHVFVVLRIYRSGGGTSPLSAAEQAAFLANVSQTIVPQAANTGSSVPTTTSNKGFAATTLASSPNPSVNNQAVALTAQVAPIAPATGTPTGSVDFRDGTALLQTVPVIGGVATLSTSVLATGTHTITAFYSGDPNFNGGMSNTVTQRVISGLVITTTSLPDGIVGQPYSGTVQATGGTPPYSWAVISGLPTPLVTTPSTPTTSLIISGTPAVMNLPGSAVLFRVTDSSESSQTYTRAITLRIANPLIAAPQTFNTTQGVAYPPTAIVTANGGIPPYSWTLSGGPVDGITVSPSGALIGTPASSGTFTFFPTVVDSSIPPQTSTGYNVLQVAPLPSITTTTLAAGTAGLSYGTQQLAATGGVAPYTWSITSGALPGGMNLSSGGVLSGTPTVTGTFNFTVQVADVYGAAATRALTLLVSAATVACSPIPSPLLAWYPFNGNAMDIRGGKPGTVVGSIAGVGSQYVAAEVGQGFKSGGEGNVVTIPAAPFLDPVNFTVGAWIRVDALSNDATMQVVWQGDNGSIDFTTTPYSLGVLGNGSTPWVTYNSNATIVGTPAPGKIVVTLTNGSGELDIFSNTVLQTGVFYYVTLSWTGVAGGATISINGTTDTTAGAEMGISSATHPFQVGGILNGTGSFAGVIDELQIWGTPLTQAQISAIYNAGAAGECQNIWFTESNSNSKIGMIAPNLPNSSSDFSTTTSNSFPFSIAAGPDGNVWFTENNPNDIGVYVQLGGGAGFSEYPITYPPSDGPSSSYGAYGIAAGPDGNLWFTESQQPEDVSFIGNITTGGTITTFQVGSVDSPHGIAAGPDGNIWFTEFSANQIAMITPASPNTVTAFSIPTATSGPESIAAGPDGNLWFTEFSANQIGRITPGGTVTEFPIPTANSQPRGITTGPDGNIWFTESGNSKIGMITPGGSVTEFPISVSGSSPLYITTGPDSNLWFTDSGTGQIGRMTTAGIVTEFATPTPNNGPWGIAIGP